MRFIDLFAGLGGFHAALKQLGHECVFASEIDEGLRDLYSKNFGLLPQGDIRKVPIESIPAHDLLCAGSPCQPFSKAGDQYGFDCPKWGDLLEHVVKILQHHKSQYFILENVPNLGRHDGGETFKFLRARLAAAGYKTDYEYLSPHEFGIPQIRERIFIVGSLRSLAHFSWPLIDKKAKPALTNILDKNPKDAKPIPKHHLKSLRIWQRFLKASPKAVELPSFPIWSMEFGATYPFEDNTPHAASTRSLHKLKGCHGKSLKGLSRDAIMTALPSYARTKRKKFPKWKRDFIRQNREFFKVNKKWIKPWMGAILEFHPSLQASGIVRARSATFGSTLFSSALREGFKRITMSIAAAANWGDPAGSNSATESFRFLRRSLHDHRSVREAGGRQLHNHQMLER